MSDSPGIDLDGVHYVLSRDAAKETGYAQDYIGQLARGAQIQARRVGGLWYVSMDSLRAYKTSADAYVPHVPVTVRPSEPDALISFDGKDYVSAGKASEITGYHQDYVGQLARDGSVQGRQVGNRWYIDKSSIVSHKKQKDSLLAAVQAQSVGLKKAEHIQTAVSTSTAFKYVAEGGDLIALEGHSTEVEPLKQATVAIRRIHDVTPVTHVEVAPKKAETTHHAIPRRVRWGGLGVHAAVATVVIFITLGYLSFNKSAVFAFRPTIQLPEISMTASVGGVFESIATILESLITRELVFIREQ